MSIFWNLRMISNPVRLLTKKTMLTSISHQHKDIGLFGYDIFQPDDFLKLSNKVCSRARYLVNQLNQISSSTKPSKVLYILDSISNELCSVVDAAELCRNIHDNKQFQEAASQTFTEISSLIHLLNTNHNIYSILKNIAENQMDHLTEEERMFVYDLKTEYEFEGIHLPQEKKELLMTLQNKIVSIEANFLENISNDNQYFLVQNIFRHQLDPIRKWIEDHVPQDSYDHNEYPDSILCSSNKRISLSVLKSVQSESARSNIWYQTWHEPIDNISQLGSLIKHRQQLSHLLGEKSYSHKFLKKQAIKDPDSVHKHLSRLSNATRDKAQLELDKLKKIKKSLSTATSSDQVFPWDIGYLTSVYNSMQKEFKKQPVHSIGIKRHDEQLSSYFSLKNCINGLVMICKSLFNIEFRQVALSSHERWLTKYDNSKNPINQFWPFNSKSITTDSFSTGIFKFDVYDLSRAENSSVHSSESSDSQTKIGTVYLDTYQRSGKFPGSAMFTIKGGCKESVHSYYQSHTNIDDSDLNIDLENLDLSNIPNQVPIAALVLNISHSSSSPSITQDGPLLSLHELETLYHEWGHLLHSLLSRTTFQHLSGTRTSMDYSEVPSHLFEHFARTPSVVNLWAKHHTTGMSLPNGVLEEALRGRADLGSLELQSQILYSASDQYVFGEHIESLADIDEKDVLWVLLPGICALQESLTCLPLAPNPPDYYSRLVQSYGNHHPAFNTAGLLEVQHAIERHDIRALPAFMPASHSHFANYGAGYYSYLFARMYAAQIWENKFSVDPLSRKSGNLLRNGMLRFGAAKNLQSILDEMADGLLDPNVFLRSFQ